MLFGRLEILNSLGQGQFGRVHRAFDRTLNREVAVKEFFKDVTEWGDESFRKEMRLLSHLHHPALVQVHDLLIDDATGTHYLTEDLVAGPSLSQFLRDASWPSRWEAFVQILQGLEFLHRQGVIHLDIKPSNVLVNPGSGSMPPQVKILDFGIADEISRFNQKGLIAGTFPYIAPEVALGEQVDGRADLYSLAVMFSRTFKKIPEDDSASSAGSTGKSIEELVRETVGRVPPPPEAFRADVPDLFREILVTLLEPNPRHRFWSANQVISRINARSSTRYALEPGRQRLPDKATAMLSGLESPLKEMCAWFDECRNAFQPLFVGAIVGRPETGKSELLDEFRRWAELRDERVVSLADQKSGLPELFERLPVTQDAAALRPYAPYLKALLPETFKEAPDPPSLETTPDMQHVQFLEKLAAALSVLTVRRNLIVLVDDLDRKADVRELLSYYCMTLGEDPNTKADGSTFLLVTSASEEALPIRLVLDRTLMLGPWSDEQAGGVLKSLLGVADPPGRLLRRLMDKTEGVPGLFVEYLRLLVEKVLRPGEDLEAQLETLDWSRLDATLNLSVWFAEELKRLSKPERTILEWLCVSPKGMMAEDLESLDPLLSGLGTSHLRRTQDLGWVRQGPEGSQLASDVRREAVLSQMNPSERAAKHLQLAERWTQLSFGRNETNADGRMSAFDRAHEYFLAGKPAQAFALARPDLQLLVRLHQPGPALRFLEEHADAAAPLPPADAITYRTLLAQAQSATARFPDAIETFRQLLNQAEGLDARAELTSGLAHAYRHGGRLNEAAEAIRGITSRLALDSRWLPVLDALLADILLEQSQYDEAAALCRSYLSGGKSCPDDERLAFRHVLAKFHLYRREMESAIPLFHRNAEETKGSGRSARHALALNSLGVAHLAQGRLDEAVSLFQSCATLSQEIGDLRGTALAYVNLGVAFHKAQNIDVSSKHYEKALTIFRRISDRTDEARALYNFGILRAQARDMAGAENAYEEALRLAQDLRMIHLEAALRLELAECFEQRSHLNRAERECEQAIDLFQRLGMPDDLMLSRLKLAEIRADRGLLREAHSELAACEPQVGEASPPLVQIRFFFAKGKSLRQTDPRSARACFEKALTTLDQSPSKDPLIREKIVREWSALTPPERVSSPSSSEPSEEVPMSSEGKTLMSSRIVIGGSAGNPSKGQEPEPGGTRQVPVQPTVTPADPPQPSADPPLHRRRTDTEAFNLLDVARKINSALDLQDLLVDIVDSLLAFTDAERGFLLLMENGAPVVRVARSHDKKDIRDTAENFSLTVAQETLEAHQPVIALDAMKDPRFKDSASIYQLQLRSVIAVPLFMRGEAIGALYMDTRLKAGRFTEQDVPLLSVLSELAAVAIYKAQLIAQNVRDQRELRKTVRELKDSKDQIETLNHQLEEANRKLKDQLASQETRLEEAEEKLSVLIREEQPKYKYERIVGSSPALRRVLLSVDRAVESRVPVLLQGESGTGKELAARAIHFNSPRKDKPFVPVNCGAMPQDLFESELFGHVKGAFTGADREKPGLFEVAEGGTLFLDEIGELPLPLQVKLLRVLQDGVIRRVGDTRERKLDVRIIAATNRDLKTLVAEKTFREDLYYRLGVYRIQIPPLRERREDIPALARAFLDQIAVEEKESPKKISKRALSALMGRPWPGNIREMENFLRTAHVVAREAEIDVQDLAQGEGISTPEMPQGRRRGQNLKSAVLEYQRELIIESLRRAENNISEAARDLGVDRSQLSIWVKKLKLKGKDS